jgi:hypothetical protein
MLKVPYQQLFHYIDHIENNLNDIFFHQNWLIFHLKLVENIVHIVVQNIVNNIENNKV